MNTISVNPAHLKPGDKILVTGVPEGEVFTVAEHRKDKAGRFFLIAKIEGVDKILALEYYKDQIKVNKIIG